MQSLLGEYEATVDAKGRFLLPAGLRKQLGEGASTFIMNRGFEKCLSLYPMSSWEPIVKQISGLNQFDPKVREFRRQFLAGATEVDLDSAGRMLLPQTLKEFAELSKDIILVGALDKVEIWDAVKYKKFFDEPSPEAFARLAAEVMTNPEVKG
jgi:MraZ protein